ncbi:MAG: hypothetical protein IPO15_15995 [Anaerolineae bacterium]|nr:hypothetical protein [Anaerolineae bacterium]
MLIKELQRHPVKRNPLHVDFYQVSMTEVIEIAVRIRLVGALQSSLGSDYVLVHNLRPSWSPVCPATFPMR